MNMYSQQRPYVVLDRLTVLRFFRRSKAFAVSDVGGRAKTLTASLIGLMLAVNGLNVINSFVGRDFITAIENRNMYGFIWWAVMYVVVFAASTVVAVSFKYTEERLGLLWREWLTKGLIERYLGRCSYYHLHAKGHIENPDQRIADDVKAFTVTTLSFALMFLNGTFTVLAFSGVLWSISPLLFLAAVAYACIGSFVSYYLGRSLVGLNYTQFDKEANLRTQLLHVRENAESVALLHREERLKSGLLNRLEELTANFEKIIEVNRNLGFYTTWYNYLAQIVPALIVAPLFIFREVEFGVVTQSAMAFTHLLGAFSLIVTNFQTISSFTAVIARLSSLEDAIDQGEFHVPPTAGRHGEPTRDQTAAVSAIDIAEDDGRVAYGGLSLLSPHDGHPLINNLTLSIPFGTRLLISGANEDAKMALFRATAGIWGSGRGQIIRPSLGQIYFLPERPYLPPVTLRELLVRTGHEQEVPEERIMAELCALKLETVLARGGGLDVAHDWTELLTLDEQQLLAFARLFLASPRFAFLERVGHALSAHELDSVLDQLSRRSISYLATGVHGKRDKDDRVENYDAVLELDVVLELMEGGGWHISTVKNGRLIPYGVDGPAMAGGG